MKRIYEQKGFVGRLRFSTLVLLLAALYGAWELWSATVSPEGPASQVFGVLFIVGAVYGFGRLMHDAGNAVATLDRSDAGDRLSVTLWRPWGAKTIAGPAATFTDWRFHIAIAGRHQRLRQLRFDHAGVRGPLTIELKPGLAALDELRVLAPRAIADFEETLPAEPAAPAT